MKKILPQFGVYPVAFSAEGGVEAMQIAAEKAQKLGSVAAIYVETPAIRQMASSILRQPMSSLSIWPLMAADCLSLLIIRFSVRSIKRPWRLVQISLSLRSRNMLAAIPISSRAAVQDQKQ